MINIRILGISTGCDNFEVDIQNKFKKIMISVNTITSYKADNDQK